MEIEEPTPELLRCCLCFELLPGDNPMSHQCKDTEEMKLKLALMEKLMPEFKEHV